MAEYSKTDFADLDDEQIKNAFINARTAPEPEVARAEGPRPLYRALVAPEPYPIAALGPILSKAASAIEAVVQCPTACAANSVLAGAALAAQAVANVELPIGEGKSAPLSIYIVTALSSGERKSTADSYALRPVREFERDLAEIEAQQRTIFDRENHVYQIRIRQAEKDFKADHLGLAKALEEFGQPPQAPLLSIVAPSGDSTMEGMFRAFERGRPDLGIFSDDGATFLGGYSLKSEQKQATIAALCRYWDGAKVERVRGGDGVNILHDRRLACHLMVQPDVAASFFSDRQFADQGLLARFLVAAPEERAGSRFRDDSDYRRNVTQATADLMAYNTAMAALLRRPIKWRDENNRPLGVVRGLLTLSPEARAGYVACYNEIESEMGPLGAFAGIKPFASKLLEHATRIAGVITLIENSGSTIITADGFANAMTLARYYAGEVRRVADSGTISPKLRQAEALRKWLQARPDAMVSIRQICQFGPGPLRSSDIVRPLMNILADHGWVESVEGGATIEGRRTKEVWAIVREV